MLRQKSLLTFGSNMTISVIGLLSVAIVSRFMGAEALGIITSTTAFASLFAIFGDFGFGIAHYKRVSEGLELRECIGTYFIIQSILTVIMGFTTVLTLFIFKNITGNFPFEEKYFSIFVIIFISVLIGNMLKVITNTFAARVEKAKESITLLSQKFFVSLFRIFTAVLGLGVIYLAWSSLAGMIIASVISIILFRKFPFGKFKKNIYKLYLIYALPSVFIGLTETVSMNIDKVLINYFAGAEQTGYYSAAQSLTSVMSQVGIVFFSIMLPTYSSLFAGDKINEIAILAGKVERYLIILLAPMVAAIIFFAGDIAKLILGKSFIHSSSIMVILSIHTFFLILNMPYTGQIMGMNKVKTAAFLSFIMLIINIICNLILIPDKLLGIPLFGLGNNGAALALLISTFFGTLVFRSIAFKLTNSKPNFKLFFILLFSFTAFALTKLMYVQFVGESKVGLIIFLILGVFLFGGISFLLKQINYADFMYYLGIINPKLMKKYLKEEFSN